MIAAFFVLAKALRHTPGLSHLARPTLLLALLGVRRPAPEHARLTAIRLSIGVSRPICGQR
jgi:hypothetical protein